MDARNEKKGPRSLPFQGGPTRAGRGRLAASLIESCYAQWRVFHHRTAALLGVVVLAACRSVRTGARRGASGAAEATAAVRHRGEHTNRKTHPWCATSCSDLRRLLRRRKPMRWSALVQQEGHRQRLQFPLRLLCVTSRRRPRELHVPPETARVQSELLGHVASPVFARQKKLVTEPAASLGRRETAALRQPQEKTD